MKISYNWLKDFVDINLNAEELAQKLVSLGIEVTAVSKMGADFCGVVTAEIKKIRKHPNADKLSLVDVDYGLGKTTVVCGALNIKEGQKVPLAIVGAKLTSGILKKAKIRGIVSQGMLCSAPELNMEGPADGILILDEETPIGRDFCEMQGESDTTFELEITPNRGDLLSHRGIARELAISLDIPLKLPKLKHFKEEGECIPIKISDTEGCHRYFGRVIKDIDLKQSPQWIKKRLRAIGITPKNAIVDVTNYVLHELGQPLHAFDLDKIGGRKISVRRAEEKEDFITLDGEKLMLNKNCLVIADDKKPAALAGIIGGAGCAISQDTKHIVVESAYFSPPIINQTSREFSLRTDASYLFERGVDIEIAKFASDRACELILETCAGNATKFMDVYPKPFKSYEVKFDPNFINNLLGTKIPNENIASILSRIDPKLETKSNLWTFHTQSHRHDLKTKWDLTEEVARFYGYDEISEEILPVIIPFADKENHRQITENLQHKLVGLGFYEVKNYDFVSEKDLKAWEFHTKDAVALKNPISLDLSFLRPSLMPCIIKSFLFNESRSIQVPWLFEIGKTYSPSKPKPLENIYCSAVLSGKIPLKSFWQDNKSKEVDFYHLKGAIETLLSGFEIKFTPASNPPPWMHPHLCANIFYRGGNIGLLGKIHPKTIDTLDLKTKNLWIFDFCVSALKNKPSVKISQISRYPSSWRDLSFIIDNSITCQAVLDVITKSNDKRLVSVELTDIYEGRNLPENKKSMTFRLIFSDTHKTLTDREVEAYLKNTLNALKQELKVDLRT